MDLGLALGLIIAALFVVAAVGAVTAALHVATGGFVIIPVFSKKHNPLMVVRAAIGANEMNYIPRRIFVKLSVRTSLALAAAAQRERRDPRDQAALILAWVLEQEQVAGELPALEFATLVQVAKDEGLSSAAEAMSLIIREWVGLKRDLSLSVEE